MRVAIDTEYSARYQESGVAPLACLAYALESDPDDVRVLLGADAVAQWVAWIKSEDVTVIGHSISNDVAVLTQAANPTARPGEGWAWELAFRMYESRRVRCTEIRQRLLGIALDDITKEDAQLSTVLRHHFDEPASPAKKASDSALALLREGTPYEQWPAELLAATPWRFKYETLAAVPLSKWPADALAYVKQDVRDVWRIFPKQSEIAGGDWITNEAVRTRAAFDLQLLAVPGWRTDRARVRDLLQRYRLLIKQCRVITVECGITRAKTFWAKKPDHPNHRTEHSTDTKLLQRLIYAALGPDTPITKAAYKRGERAAMMTLEQLLANAARDRGAIEKAIVARGGKPCLFVEAIAHSAEGTLEAWLVASGDPDLNAYRLAQYAHKLVSAFLVNFDTDKRVRTSYNALVATGRTSSRGSKSAYAINVQQQPTDRDKPPEFQIRGCFVPDEGEVLIGVDYSQLELCGLGHLLSVVGREHTGDPDYASTLARAINDGDDCHAKVAAGLEGISYAEALRLRASKDEDFDLVRKLAKAVNFGLPGGMGWRSFIDFALTAYGLPITPAKAKQARELWMDTWIEIPWYFSKIRQAVNAGGGRCTVTQLYSDRVRGGCRYTAACNSLFQGIAADGAIEALRLITNASYRGAASLVTWLKRVAAAVATRVKKAAGVLRDVGFRPIMFVHDEFVGAQPDPLLFLTEDLGYSKTERWAAYNHAKAKQQRGAEDEFDTMVIDQAERGLNALSTLMIEGMRRFIPDVAIRTDGKIFPERWGK